MGMWFDIWVRKTTYVGRYARWSTRVCACTHSWVSDPLMSGVHMLIYFGGWIHSVVDLGWLASLPHDPGVSGAAIPAWKATSRRSTSEKRYSPVHSGKVKAMATSRRRTGSRKRSAMLKRTTSPVTDYLSSFDGGDAVFIRTILEGLHEEGGEARWKPIINNAVNFVAECGYYPTDNQIRSLCLKARWSDRLITLEKIDTGMAYTATLTDNPRFLKELTDLFESDWGLVDDE